jgi:hypothetical protein
MRYLASTNCLARKPDMRIWAGLTNTDATKYGRKVAHVLPVCIPFQPLSGVHQRAQIAWHLRSLSVLTFVLNRMFGLVAGYVGKYVGGRCVIPRVDGWGRGRSTFRSFILVQTRPVGSLVILHSAPPQYGDFLTSCTTIFISANTVFCGDKLLVWRRRMNLILPRNGSVCLLLYIIFYHFLRKHLPIIAQKCVYLGLCVCLIKYY